LVLAVIVAQSLCVGFIEVMFHVTAGEAAVFEHGEVEALREVVGDIGEI